MNNIKNDEEKKHKSVKKKSSHDSITDIRDKPHFHGHRSRLKQKAALSLEAFHNYELIELLLFSLVPRKDVKPLAKDILRLFNGSLKLLCEYQNRVLSFKTSSQNNIADVLVSLINASYNSFFTDVNNSPNIQFRSPMEIISYLVNDFYARNLRLPITDYKNYKYSILFLNKRQILMTREDTNNFSEDKIVKRSVLEGVASLVIIKYLNKSYNLNHHNSHLQEEINAAVSNSISLCTENQKKNPITTTNNSFLGFVLVEKDEDIDLNNTVKILENEVSDLYYRCMSANIKLIDYLVINDRNVVSLKSKGVI